MIACVQTSQPVPLHYVAVVIESAVNQGWAFVSCFQSGLLQVNKKVLDISQGPAQNVIPAYTIVFSREYAEGEPKPTELNIKIE